MRDINEYLYFFFSSEYERMRNEAENTLGNCFISGTVVESGTKKKYSYMSTDKNFMRMYPDAKLIAEGFDKKYEEPTIEPKRGN